MKVKDQELFICTCHSEEHQMLFYYIEEYNELYVSIHLNQYDNIFKRIWTAVKYIFGHKSRYGEWDSFIINSSDAERLIDTLNVVKKKHDYNMYINLDNDTMFVGKHHKHYKDLIRIAKDIRSSK